MPTSGVIVKAGTLNTSLRNAFRVLVRDTVNRPGTPTHGRWVPLTRCGHTIIAFSEKDARELVLKIGGELFPAGPTDGDDEAWERRLLRENFRIEPFDAHGSRFVTFDQWMRRWVCGVCQACIARLDLVM